MIIYYVAATEDGYIAGPNHEIDFLELANPPEGSVEDYGYASLYASVDVCVWGKATYDTVMKKENGKFPYPDKENFILSRSKKGTGANKEHFVQFDEKYWREYSAEKDVWLVGGGVVAQMFADAALIDKLILTTIPTKLGEGIAVFSKGFNADSWKLESTKKWDNGVSQAVYLKA